MDGLDKFYLSLFSKEMLNAEASFLINRLNRDDNIIDVGCGSGVLEQSLTSFNIVGVYDSADLLATARKRSKNLFVKGVAENLPFLKEEFKTGIINLSVSYIKNWKRAISELHSTISKEGRLFIFLINPDININNIDVFKNGYINNIINLDELEDYLSKLFIINEFYPIKFNYKKKEIVITAISCSKGATIA